MQRKHLRNYTMAKYKKYDGSKPRLELIDPEFILGIGKVLTFGAEKYDDKNWKNATHVDRNKSVGSLMRHVMAYQNGELIDPESGLEHLHHMATNIMFMAWYDKNLKEPSIDNAGQTYMEIHNGNK